MGTTALTWTRTGPFHCRRSQPFAARAARGRPQKTSRHDAACHGCGHAPVEARAGSAARIYFPHAPPWSQVVIRVRPPLRREVDGGKLYQQSIAVSNDDRVITISENLSAWRGEGKVDTRRGAVQPLALGVLYR